eukprot:4523909-Heterocapsa_arctica.AAC.1
MFSGEGKYVPQFSRLDSIKTNDILYKLCIAHTHKLWKNEDSDHTDHDSDGDYPGHNVRKEAYNIMVENHKDTIFQKQEEAVATRKRKL